VHHGPGVYCGPPDVYRGPPEVYRGPCMKNMALNQTIIFTDVSQNLRRTTRNGITERSQSAPPIIGWAAITSGIGSHSSFLGVVDWGGSVLVSCYRGSNVR